MADSFLPMMGFHTAVLGQEEAREIWRTSIGQFYEFLPGRSEDLPFSAAIDIWNVNGFLLTSGRYNGQRFLRSEARARTDGFDHYTLFLHRSGRFVTDTGKVMQESSDRLVTVLDFARPVVTDADENDSITLSIPRDVLDEVMPAFDMHGLTVDGAMGRILSEFLLGMPRQLGSVVTSEAPAVAEACRRMVAACLAPSRARTENARPQIEAVLLRRAKRITDANMQDPEWGVENLLGALAVSRSTLYRLLGPYGGVAEFIRGRRLTRAHILLVESARSQRLNIGEVAYLCGFQSDTTFSRAFRHAFGYSPRDARDGGGHGLVSMGRGNAGDPEGTTFVDWIQNLRTA